MINLEKARESLKTAMETQGPDFVYCPDDKACHYTKIPQSNATGPSDPRTITGCLVGVALDIAGETRHHDFGGYIVPLARMYPDMMTEATLQYFRIAQRLQDKGCSWGYSYQQAEASVEQIKLHYPEA